ncbi:YwmB family TATA-box binding protein [Virgibacillus ndiopensis]|uniref:YwmB family TATA-box binding protein n=1 Tax=Virgibacillus ndiopensis TaxID=2004408 RepID=UPI000C08D0A2|nr:YwmB family TATA-box binding protein [Virgibacillus ndiopensis]
MKKTGLIFILLLLFTTRALAHTNHDEMIDLATLVEESNLTIDEWQVTIKEQIDRNGIQYKIKQLRNSYLVSTSEDENVIKYSFSDVHKTSEVNETYKVIIPKNKSYKAEIIGVLSGEVWSNSIKKNYQKKLSLMLEQFFTQSAKKFACLTTISNDTISSDYFLNELKQKLNLQHISTQYDSIQNSMHEKIIYGYTPLWKQQITVMDKPMNVQLAVRAGKNESTKFTIGTPILITEY